MYVFQDQRKVILKYIKESDILIKSQYIGVLNDIIKGLILLSDLYGKYITSMFNFLQKIEDQSGSSKTVSIHHLIKFFNTYKSTIEKYLKEEEYEIITKQHYVPLPTEEGAPENYVFITLDNIAVGYYNLMKDTRSMCIDPEYKDWKNHYSIIEDDLKTILSEINAFYESFYECFIDSDYVGSFNRMTKKVKINNLKSIIDYSNYTLAALNNLYEFIITANFAIHLSIDIEHPLQCNISDTDDF